MNEGHEHAPGGSAPARRRDRTVEAVALRRREIERGLAELVTPEMVAEHQDRPIGCHSPALSWVLAYFRQAPTIGKLVVHARRPALLPGTARQRGGRSGDGGTSLHVLRLSGHPGTVHEALAGGYGTEAEALHAVFLRRLADYGMTASATAAAPADGSGTSRGSAGSGA